MSQTNNAISISNGAGHHTVFQNEWLLGTIAQCLEWRDLVALWCTHRSGRLIGAKPQYTNVLADGKAEMCFTNAYKRQCRDFRHDVRLDRFKWENIGAAFKTLFQLLAPLREHDDPNKDVWVQDAELRICMHRVAPEAFHHHQSELWMNWELCWTLCYACNLSVRRCWTYSINGIPVDLEDRVRLNRKAFFQVECRSLGHLSTQGQQGDLGCDVCAEKAATNVPFYQTDNLIFEELGE